MKRNKKTKTLEETLGAIDGVHAALDSYPNLEDALLEKAQGEANKFLGQFFPTQLDFAKEILEHLVGTDALIDIVSKFLTVALPGVEVSLKSVLLANMQNLGTNCTIDPIIYEKAIKEGVIFDLKQIDLYDKLTVSPLDRKIGKYFYFGIEGCESAYDILQSAIDPSDENKNDNQKKQKETTSYTNRAINDSVGHYFGGRKRDFDCLLWYMKNKASNREVWGKRTSLSEDIFYGDENLQEWINKKGDTKTCYYKINGNSISFLTKSGSSVTTPSGGSMTPVSEGTDYIFKDGKTFYVYSYGKPQIKKINRKKYYLNRVSDENYDVYFFKDTSWVKKSFKNENYPYMEKLPTTIKKDDFVVVDNSVYVIKDEPKLKTEKRKDENGLEYNETFVSNVKNEECIDITNDIKNNTCIFVDYDLEGNKEKVKNGTATSTFSTFCSNEGQKQWYKSKSSATSENISNGNCYYIKKSEGDFDPNVDKILIPPHILDEKSSKMCVNVNEAKQKNNKYTKDFGVLTLEYSPRTGNVIQSDGKPMQQQTPYDNVLHAFFGNVKELHTSERDKLQEELKTSSETNRIGVQVYDDMIAMRKKHLNIWSRKLKEWDKIPMEDWQHDCDLFYTASSDYVSLTFGNDIDINSCLNGSCPIYDDIEGIYAKLNNIKLIIERYKKNIYDIPNDEIFKENDNNGNFDFGFFQEFEKELIKELGGYSVVAYGRRASQIMDSNESLLYFTSKDLSYPEAEKNYYLKRTLFEFNTDYVTSLQLFDSKVLAAQLITSLFGGLTMSAVIGATASWKTELIRDVVKDMIEKTIAAEDIAISDCFFTFTNDSYNGMLRATELKQAGLYSRHGEENGNNKINPIKLLEGLNNIDSTADQAGQITIIKGAITTAAGEVCKDIYKENNYLSVNTNFGINMSFIETLMINLCTQIVMAMLSPKVYLLILINLEMFGLSTNFDLKSFLERFSNLIRSIVKSVVDQFMQFLAKEIMRIIEKLKEKLISKLAFEQAEMYMRLLKQILMHLRLLTSYGNSNIGWTQDIVTSADIESSDSQEPVDEC